MKLWFELVRKMLTGSASRESGSRLILPGLSLLLLSQLPVFGEEIDYNTAHLSRNMEAIRTTEPIVLDGNLDEPAWKLAEPAKNFTQKVPFTGQPASEDTEVRIIFDDESLYVGVYCFDSAGPEGIIVNDVTKDFFTLDSDGFQIVLDTFNDNRNSFLFATNPASGRFDMQVAADGNRGNSAWDGIWYVETRITEEGWQVEMEIPFKTLRFLETDPKEWGVNFERRVRRKFEDSYWAPIPPPYRVARVSIAGTLRGVEHSRPSRNLFFKPYVILPVLRREDDDWDVLPDAGLDVKWGVTSQLTLDLTVNTDFSQVEVDQQQINLTRFSLFFPEKRDFFLENANIFDWGMRKPGFRFRPDFIPFFSRRIGLTEDGAIVPILGGARLTGRTGPYTIGLMTMQTAEFGRKPPDDSLDPRAETDEDEEEEYEPSTNFIVTRVRRDLLRKSDVGGIFVNKQELGGSHNRTYGLDGNFNFFEYLDISPWILRTETPDLKGDDVASDLQVAWRDEFFNIWAGHLRLGENVNPEVGFAPRTGIHKTSGDFGITPRPEEKISWIRELNPSIEADYITNTENVLETRRFEGRFTAIFSDSSMLSVAHEDNFERLFEPFTIREGDNGEEDDIVIPEGDYNFAENSLFFRSNRSKWLSIMARLSSGGFFDGQRDSYTAGFTLRPSYHFSTEISWGHNQVRLPGGDFDTDLIFARIGYSYSSNVFFDALLQYNSDSQELSSNLRFDWVIKPLSDLYLVYNERRSRDGEVIERAIIAKLSYVFAF